MKTFFTGCLTALCFSGIAQIKPDSTKKLKEVEIRPYFSVQPLIRSTGSIGIIDQTVLDRQPAGSFVSAVNTIPGVRMEERSPGSYRLSIRGSLLRSPFGIRNVKIYLDDFPLTDAGGNSYLNALDVSGTFGLQVLKGPHSSIFGANSGGVIHIQPQTALTDSTALALKLEGGSYGTFHENLALNQRFNKYSLNITQAWQRSDGYRDHSAMDRKYVQTLQQWDYTRNAALKALIFYSDLHYNTPGGLTEVQYLQNPKLSRPAAGPSKSAIEQQAGIYSKTLYGGLSHNWQIATRLKHVISVFSSYTDFKNPFISNYEKRKEFTLGLRSYVEYEKKQTGVNWKVDLGVESMQTRSDISNYDNNFGQTTALQYSDKLKAGSNFAFGHLGIDLMNKWLFELSASANLYKYAYESLAPVAIAQRKNSFEVQFMPRAALSYLIDQQFSARASISKGYSPPSLAEIRASNNVINVDLQPEYGWNYESGLRYQTTNNRLFIDLTGFYYHLKSAIVRRLDQNDAEYFINAGGTKQWGLESTLSFWIIPVHTSGIIRGLQFRNAYTLSQFKFDNYIDKTDNFSGNQLTGVPKTMLLSSADVQLPKDLYFFLQHNFTSQIPLNDANTAYAKKYHILQAKIGCKNLRINRFPVEIFAGADNLLNQKYSLGNDLNAFGGRYYNAAAKRSFYGGLAVRFNRI
ncbi:TonB-dependent receptor [Pedobacter heparinus]|uniref:TonB-dependent receptor n=1 Tax=Pedobacter heparinus TaxID=984 RepID=UPI0029313007|nr:TonB-dependent receptor [Pedobacter heparinus]